MKLAEIRKLSTGDLSNECNKLREEISQLRRRVHAGETTNNRQIRNKRKDLARILTVLQEQLTKEVA